MQINARLGLASKVRPSPKPQLFLQERHLTAARTLVGRCKNGWQIETRTISLQHFFGRKSKK